MVSVEQQQGTDAMFDQALERSCVVIDLGPVLPISVAPPDLYPALSDAVAGKHLRFEV